MTAFKSFTEFTNVGKFKLCSARTSKGFHEFVSTTGVFPEEKWFISLENLSEQVQENIKDFILTGKCDVTKEEAEKTNNNSKKNVYIETKDGFNLDPEFVQHVMLPERYGENTLNVPSHEYYRVPHMYLIDSETINDYHVDVLDKLQNDAVHDPKCIDEVRHLVYNELVYRIEEEQQQRNEEFYNETKKVRPVIPVPDNIDDDKVCEKFLEDNGISPTAVKRACQEIIMDMAGKDILCVIEGLEKNFKNITDEKTLLDVIDVNLPTYPIEENENGKSSPALVNATITPFFKDSPTYNEKPFDISIPADFIGKTKSYIKHRDASLTKFDMDIDKVFYKYDTRPAQQVEYDFATGKTIKYTRS